jgi:SAM-dependent methyltransferase
MRSAPEEAAGLELGGAAMENFKKQSITEMRKRKFADQIGVEIQEDGVLAQSFFDWYSGDQSYDDAFEDSFSAEYVIDLIKAIWDPASSYKLLDCGSANGLTLKQFDRLGVEAWGIENSAYMHSKTPKEWRERNLLGDVCEMPFEDDAFDFLYVTCLVHLPEEKISQAIKELFRVCRVGVVLSGVTTDMTEEVIQKYELFVGLRTFWTFSEWSDAMVCAGFQLAISDPVMLDEVWRIEQEAEGDEDWYPDKEYMKHCFFSKPQTKRNS